MSNVRTLFCVALLLALVGCDSESASDDKKGKAKAKGDAPTWAPYSVDAPLLDFDDTTEVPPLDNGRLNIKYIADWKEVNQKRGNLFVFLKGGKSYPSLIVQKPEDAGDIKELDETTKTAYLPELTKALIDKHDKKYITEQPKLIEINGRPWVFYRVQMASSTEKLDVMFLTTIANGRKYTLELRAIDKKGNQDWPALLTLASGMTFGGDKKPADPMPEAEKPEPGKTEPGKTEPEKTEPAKEAPAEPDGEK